MENIRMLTEILRSDYTVLFAKQGQEAVELACRHLPDLILLDIRMPGMSGHEVCQRLKAEPATRHIPIIFVTMLGEEEDEALGLAIGGVDYITKPVRPAIVRARVRVHLRLKAYQDRLEAISMTDGLTGIANRRHFDAVLAREWNRAQRFGNSLSLIMADVDHFKLYNDTYGHQAGDECLKQVAAVLSGRLMRATDLAARLGGEEFVCLVPDIPARGAMELAQGIVEAMRAAAIPHVSSLVASCVTVSIGLATLTPTADLAPAALLEMADQFLYQAKHAGRNRVVGGDPGHG